jgi:hypothetical protein
MHGFICLGFHLRRHCGVTNPCIRANLYRIRRAQTTRYQGTVPTSINDGGSITGYTIGSDDVTRAFVRLASGEIVEFAAPNAGADASSGTFPWSISSGGVVTGDFADALHVYHGFVRAADGTS